MKKKVLTTLIIGIAAIGVTAAVVPATVAWFNKKTEIDGLSINGGAEGAYFAGGDGSSEHPYLITKPIHVYNLAWLQYLGTFNKTTSGTTIDQQFYFKVENDIDMGGLVIPPIGTEQYPFVGNFDGDNHTIGNFKTTNDYSSLVKKPYSVTKLENVDIVGFFGLVGKKQDSSLVYFSEENEVKNFGLYDFCIESSAQNTLVGMAAGYVNGVLSGVGVNKGLLDFKETATPITSITGNLSEYSTIGYCTDEYISQCEIRDTDYYEPSIAFDSTSHGGTEWGASIPMADIYNDLKTIYNTTSNRISVYTAETRNYDTNGNLIGQPIFSSSEDTSVSNGKIGLDTSWFGTSNYYMNYERKGSDGLNTASYCIYHNSNGQNYIYLYGYKQHTISNGKTVTINNFNKLVGKKIKDSNNNYVKITFSGSTSNISSTTVESEASVFYVDNNNRYVIYNDRTANYLTYQNSSYNLSLTTTQNNGKKWVVENNGLRSDDLDNYYLSCTNGQWKLTQGELSDYMYFNTTGTTKYYIVLTSTSVSSTTNKNSATKLYTDAQNRIYTTINGTTYYVAVRTTFSGNTANYSLVSSDLNNDTDTAFAYNGTTITATVKSNKNSTQTRTVYLRLQNGNFNIYSGTNTGTSYRTPFATTLDTISNPQISLIDGTFYEPATSSQKEDIEVETNPTYFPLLWNDNKTAPADKNTGYIVSGIYNTYEGDIRVSGYAKNSIYRATGNTSTSGYSYNNNNLHVITRTANSNGYVAIKDEYNKNVDYSASGYSTIRAVAPTSMTVSDLGFEKYASSRQNLGTTISSESYLYGLHFMDASISTDHKVTVPHAKINSLDKYNFELPEDCIDFNLKAKGFINFFGGTYFTNGGNNNTFFSLHEIKRNGNELSDIKEISQIYLRTGVNVKTNSAPYFYKYSDNSFSDNYNPSVDSPTPTNLVFDMSWVTQPSIAMNAVYYYEIPVNSGEFALGSVSGKQGAYLMYLDIGAAAMTDDSYVITHKLSSQVKSYSFPKGVDFNENVAITSSSTHDYTNIQGGDVATVTVPTNVKGEISYELDDDILSCGPPSGVTLRSKFCASDITIKANGSVIDSDGGLVYKEVTMQKHSISFNTGTGVLSEILEVEHFFYDSDGNEQTDKYYKETVRSSTTEGVETNPYNYTAIDGLTTILTKTYFIADNVPDLFIDVYYDQINQAYYITFYANKAGNMKVTLGDTLSGLTVYITNYSETEAVEAGETYEITAELREAN